MKNVFTAAQGGMGNEPFFFPSGPNFGVVKLLSREHAVHGIDTINVVTYLFFFMKQEGF